MSHILVVGGTGMLRAVSLHFASQGNTVSVVARSIDRLNLLAQGASHLTGHINLIHVDYRKGTTLRAKIEEAHKIFGPVTLTVCWIHSIAPKAPYIVAQSIGGGPSVCRYFDVLGSINANPLHLKPQRDARFKQFDYILYRKIILGFVIENDISRWLTNNEISSGVLQAIEQDELSYVIGTVQPWSAHP